MSDVRANGRRLYAVEITVTYEVEMLASSQKAAEQAANSLYDDIVRDYYDPDVVITATERTAKYPLPKDRWEGLPYSEEFKDDSEEGAKCREWLAAIAAEKKEAEDRAEFERRQLPLFEEGERGK